MKGGALLMGLDPAAAYAEVMPIRDDISYFVTHPCHPPLFNDDTDPRKMQDWFGGVYASQHIVCALHRGPEEDYVRGERIAIDMFGNDYGPVIKSHRISVEQMAMLEPALVETFSATLVQSIKDLRDEVVRKSIPHGADRYLGFLMSTFFFILMCNLLGLVPTMATATGNISVTAGLALVAFVVIQAGGIREYGVIKHFKNLVPPGLPLWLVPIMFVLELLSMFIKPFALCIRLFANMMAGHVVILAFISLIFILAAMFSPIIGWAASPIAVFFALFVYLLEILVALLQAYIFTMLTAQFIGMSVHPAH
jgi:ATP synthase subunit 6